MHLPCSSGKPAPQTVLLTRVNAAAARGVDRSAELGTRARPATLKRDWGLYFGGSWGARQEAALQRRLRGY
eukprot:2566778-Prymnesium_polylepis.1